MMLGCFKSNQNDFGEPANISVGSPSFKKNKQGIGEKTHQK
jgi:hypothetical protein